MPDEAPDVAEQLVPKHQGPSLSKCRNSRKYHDRREGKVSSTDKNEEKINGGFSLAEEVGETDKI